MKTATALWSTRMVNASKKAQKTVSIDKKENSA
jgi:hypothetical protein